MLIKLLFVVGTSVVIYFAIAVGLILSQPRVAKVDGDTLDFDKIVVSDTPLMPQEFTYSDGYKTQIRHIAGDGPLIVMIHGSGWYGQQFDLLAQSLAGLAEVLVPDLRGHGPIANRRGDVAYIGQLEDDLAELIGAYRKDGQKVIVLGHSSGGGFVIRMAGGAQGALIDQAILLAPFIHHRAATMRPNAGGWSKVLVRRIIGLSMLNSVGIKALNGMTIVQFNMPQAVLNGDLGAGATTEYSYRLNTSYAPRNDYTADIAALPKFDLIAGTNDEAFVAQNYETVLSAQNDRGRYHLIDGKGHLDIVAAKETLQIIKGIIGEF